MKSIYIFALLILSITVSCQHESFDPFEEYDRGFIENISYSSAVTNGSDITDYYDIQGNSINSPILENLDAVDTDIFSIANTFGDIPRGMVAFVPGDESGVVSAGLVNVRITTVNDDVTNILNNVKGELVLEMEGKDVQQVWVENVSTPNFEYYIAYSAYGNGSGQ